MGRNYADWLIRCHRFILPAWLRAATFIKMANLNVVREAILTLADQFSGVAWAVPPQNSGQMKVASLTFYSIFLLITAIGYCPHVILIGELGYIMPIRISCLEIPGL